MKNQLDLRLIITIGTMLLTVGSAWGIVAKSVKEVDRNKDKIVDIDKRVTKEEVKTENLEENIMEQKTMLTEQRTDIKEILRYLRSQ